MKDYFHLLPAFIVIFLVDTDEYVSNPTFFLWEVVF